MGTPGPSMLGMYVTGKLYLKSPVNRSTRSDCARAGCENAAITAIKTILFNIVFDILGILK